MSSKRKRQQMSATYCRAYLVTLGLLLAGGGAAFAVLAWGSVSTSAIGVALLICVMGVALLMFGFWGRRGRWNPGRRQRPGMRSRWC